MIKCRLSPLFFILCWLGVEVVVAGWRSGVGDLFFIVWSCWWSGESGGRNLMDVCVAMLNWSWILSRNRSLLYFLLISRILMLIMHFFPGLINLLKFFLLFWTNRQCCSRRKTHLLLPLLLFLGWPQQSSKPVHVATRFNLVSNIPNNSASSKSWSCTLQTNHGKKKDSFIQFKSGGFLQNDETESDVKMPPQGEESVVKKKHSQPTIFETSDDWTLVSDLDLPEDGQ